MRKKEGNKIECMECYDSGYISFTKDGLAYSRRCECLEARIRQYHLQTVHIPKSMLEKDLNNFIINNPSQEKTVCFLKEYINKYPDLRYGLLFMGPAGTGKTHLAIGVIKALRQKTDKTILFVDTSSLLREIKQNINEKSFEEQIPDIIKEVSNAHILLLDDLGSQKVSMWTQDIIKLIINYRYNNGLITLITTPYEDKPKTMDKEKLSQRIGEINRSRLYEMCKTIHMQGDDFRKMMINPRLL